jgi:ATP-binding cassette subfamily B protein
VTEEVDDVPTTERSEASTSRVLSATAELRDVDGLLAPVRPWKAFCRVLGLLVRAAPVALTVHMLLVAIASLGPAVLSAATGAVIEGVSVGGEPTIPVAPAAVAAGAMLALGVAAAVDGSAQFIVGERFTAAIEQEVMRTAVSLPGLELFEDPRFSERLEITRWTAGGDFSGGGGAARAYMDSAIVARHLVGVLGTAVVLWGWGWWVSPLVLATMLPHGVLTWRHGGAQAREEQIGGVERRRSDWFLDLGLSSEGGKEIRLFALGPWLRERHHAAWQRAFRGVLRIIGGHARREAVMAAVTTAAVVAVVWSAAARVDDGSLAAGRFVAGLLALPFLLTSARSLARAPGEFRYRLAHIPKVAALLDLDVPRPAARRPVPAGVAAEIRFEGVSFSYPGTDRRVLDGFDLVIEAGTSMALVGENGCGKSTLVKLLCRLHDPDEGRILLEGVDVREYDLRSLRATIATLFQEPVHYPFSLDRNVSVGHLDRPDVVTEAAALAGVDDVANRLPGGGATVLDPALGGVDVSGGEWQRIALARTLAAARGNRASVLVADEPTAHLDVRIEHELYRRFTSLTEGRTTLLISHRFSTVRMADRIAVMEGGRVVELGDHASLVAAGGRYAQLHALQAERFAPEDEA